MTNTYHAFLSYTRHDDDSSGGRITRLKELLETEIRSVLGVRDFEIFQDVDDIEAGDHWPSLLEGMVDQARFFIPVLTPSYFNSPMCRRELQRFIDAENEFRRGGLILPILFRDCRVLTDEKYRSTDDLAELLYERNYSDWRRLRKDELKPDKIPDEVEQLAERIEKIWHAAPILQSEMAKTDPALPQNNEIAESKVRFLEQRLEAANQQIAVLKQQLAELNKQQQDNRKNWVFGPHRSIFREVDEFWCPEMVVIDPPDKTFLMGAPKYEAKSHDSEKPQHKVTISKRFALGRYTVSFHEYDFFCDSIGLALPQDRGWGRARRPVIYVSWVDALKYLAWLNERLGLGPGTYRLPSEAEWEFACRAGSAGPFWTGETISTEQANHNGNHPYGTGPKGEYRKKTVAVDELYQAVNPWGLAHVHGNVWEWCADHWHESYLDQGRPDDGSAWSSESEARALRGGSWNLVTEDLRSAKRTKFNNGFQGHAIGFRVARTL